MSNTNNTSDEHRHETSTDAITTTSRTNRRLSRRDYLKLTGAAAVAGLGATGTAAAADYRTITVGAGETLRYRPSYGDTLENILFDISADEAFVDIYAKGGNWTIRNIGFKGRFTRTDDNANEIIAAETDAGESGLIENIYFGDGAIQGYGTPIKITLNHAGTVKIRRCHMQHWPGHAVYGASPGRDPPDADGGGGDVHIEQCYSRNNNLDGFRIGTDGSYVRDSVIHVDKSVPGAYNDPDKVNARGVWVKEGGDCTIKNCDILLEHPDGSACVWEGDREETGVARVRDSQIEARGDSVQRFYGNVDVGPNVGQNPDVSVPAGVPQSPKAAANGGNNDGGGDLPNRITMDGKGPGLTNYSFNVSGDLEPAPPSEGEAGNDVDDSNMTGAVNEGGTDAFYFSGEIGYFNYSEGNILVTVNGHIIDNPETHWD